MKILCLGDSLTFGTGVRRNESWLSLVQKDYNWNMINRGIPGDTTGGILTRLTSEIERAQPNAIAVTGGANDIFASGDDHPARANITAIVNQTLARGITPIVCSPPPIHPAACPANIAQFINPDTAQIRLRDYAAWIQQFCTAFSLVHVDFWSPLESARNQPDKKNLYPDGIHPGPIGHKIMAETFGKTVGETLTKMETA